MTTDNDREPPFGAEAGISAFIRVGSQNGVICTCPRMAMENTRPDGIWKTIMVTVFAQVWPDP